MTSRILSPSESKFSAATHAFELTYNEIAAISGTNGAAIPLISVPAGMKAKCTAMVLNTPFRSPNSTGTLTLSIGDGVSSSEARFLAATQLAAAGTEILYSAGTGTEYAYLAADTSDAFFDSATENLSVFNAGSVTVYLKLINLNDLPNPATE